MENGNIMVIAYHCALLSSGPGAVILSLGNCNPNPEWQKLPPLGNGLNSGEARLCLLTSLKKQINNICATLNRQTEESSLGKKK